MGNEGKNPGLQPKKRPPILAPPPDFTARLKDMNENGFKCELPVKLNITLFQVAFVKTSPPVQRWIKTAEIILAPHNVSLDVHPGDGQPIKLNYNGGPLSAEFQYGEIRRAAHEAFDDKANPMRLPIIICEFGSGAGREAAGVTKVNHNNIPDGRVTLEDGVTWLPFVLIDANGDIPDFCTLVHEIAHAAVLKHDSAGNDVFNILNVDSADRTRFARRNINKFQLRNLAKAYFARPKLVIK